MSPNNGQSLSVSRHNSSFQDLVKNGKSNASKKGPEILVGTPGRIFELIKLKKIKMMNVETIILDEFDQLLSDSQYHFVDKISHYAPRDHQYIYMSATAKVDPDQLEENTLRVTVDGVSLDNIQHFYMQVDKRDKVELLRKLAYVEDFRGLAFSTAYLIWVVLKKNYNTVGSKPYRSPAMSMSNTARSFGALQRPSANPSCWPPIWSLVESILNILSV